MKVIDIVKAKLDEPRPSDEALSIHIEEVGQAIKTYCNRKDIPTELRFVYANMVVDLIKGEEKKVSPNDHKAITGIKEGDVQISFGGTNSTKSEMVTEDLLFNYKVQLNKFRKVRW